MISAENSTSIDRPAEEVFAFVTDASNDPQWHTDVMDARRVTDGAIGPGTTFVWGLNYMGRKEGRMVISDYRPPRQAQLRAERPVMGLQSTITYLFEPSNGSTVFTRRVELEPSGFMRLVAPLMGRRLAGENATFLANLKALLEGREDR